MPHKKHNIVIKNNEGGVDLYPMKAWLRANPDILSEGYNTIDYTSHELRRYLIRIGWGFQDTESQVLLIKPDEQGEINYIENTLGDQEDNAQEEEHFDFALESHLRDFIVQNMESILVDQQHLHLYNGNFGVEYSTGVGLIDILATNDNGDLVVFELKLSRGSDRALGQLLRYMGWVKQNLAGNHYVFGIIVAQNITENLKYAASVTPNIKLFEYQLNFQITETHLG